MKRKSVIVTVTGASGVGKTSVLKQLLADDAELRLIQSITTRNPRLSDIPGEYCYVSDKEFSVLEKRGAFLWAVSVHGSRYGTMKSDVDHALEKEEDVFLIILVPERVETLKAYSPLGRVVSLYIASPPPDVLLARLRLRGDSEESIERRIRDCADWDGMMKRSAVQ